MGMRWTWPYCSLGKRKEKVNLLASRRCGWNFRSEIFKLILQIFSNQIKFISLLVHVQQYKHIILLSTLRGGQSKVYWWTEGRTDRRTQVTTIPLWPERPRGKNDTMQNTPLQFCHNMINILNFKFEYFIQHIAMYSLCLAEVVPLKCWVLDRDFHCLESRCCWCLQEVLPTT